MVTDGAPAPERHLIIEISRDASRIKTSLYQSGHRDESPVRPYDVIDVDFNKVDGILQELFDLLQRGHSRPFFTRELADGFKKSGQVLLDLLLPHELKRVLDTIPCTTVSLCLEESLMYVPWEFLHDGTRYLCQRFALGRILSTRQLPAPPRRRPVQPPFRVLIVADPRGNLDSAYREGIEIRRFMDELSEMFLADFKSEPVDAAFVKKNLRSYGIIHYAGHAEYSTERPNKSGWLLTDGRIEPSDIHAMSGLAPMPSLVFSNACQTGRIGQSACRGELSLVNAFLLSGTRHYIGTFWDIGDEPGLHLAEGFYRNLALGKSVGEALMVGRRELVEEFGEESLLSATHILYGDPASVYKTKIPREAARSPASGALQSRSSTGRAPRALPRKSSRLMALGGALGLLILVLGALGYSFSNQNGEPAYALYLSRLFSNGSESGNVLPLTLNIQVVSQRGDADGRYTPFVVAEGTALQSRDKFQVQAITNRSAYLYVLLYDSQGLASQLFPHPKIDQSGFTRGGTNVVVPGKDLWF